MEVELIVIELDLIIVDLEEYKFFFKKCGGIVGILIVFILFLIVVIFGYNYFKNNNLINF